MNPSLCLSADGFVGGLVCIISVRQDASWQMASLDMILIGLGLLFPSRWFSSPSIVHKSVYLSVLYTPSESVLSVLGIEYKGLDGIEQSNARLGLGPVESTTCSRAVHCY